MGRLRVGRFQLYIEPRDIWVGVYVAPDAIYACPLPLVVIRWDRHQHDPIECGCELTPNDAPLPRWRCNRVERCRREDGHDGGHRFDTMTTGS